MTHESNNNSRERRCYGRPNAEILDDIGNYPLTLDDMGYQDLSKHWTRFYKIYDKVNLSPAGWRNSELLADLGYLQQLDHRLPQASPEDHSVYLVTSDHVLLGHSFGHWSFYSQGYFFHLTAQSDTKLCQDATVETKSSGPGASHPEVKLRVQNLVCADEPNFVSVDERIERKALLAYQVGHTRFNMQQMEQLARYLITTLATYNVYERNCQSFVLSMVFRTVMAQGDGLMFIGNIYQIVHWDLRRRLVDERFYSRQSGYLLKAVSMCKTDESLLRHLWHWFPTDWASIRWARQARAIATLYRHGEFTIGAYDPTGQRDRLQYAMHLFREDMKDLFQGQVSELGQDLVHGRWRDAFYGRPERRRLIYLQHQSKAQRGNSYEKALLPVHGWLLMITKKERQDWAAQTPGEAPSAVELPQL